MNEKTTPSENTSSAESSKKRALLSGSAPEILSDIKDLSSTIVQLIAIFTAIFISISGITIYFYSRNNHFLNYIDFSSPKLLIDGFLFTLLYLYFMIMGVISLIWVTTLFETEKEKIFIKELLKTENDLQKTKNIFLFLKNFLNRKKIKEHKKCAKNINRMIIICTLILTFLCAYSAYFNLEIKKHFYFWLGFIFYLLLALAILALKFLSYWKRKLLLNSNIDLKEVLSSPRDYKIITSVSLIIYLFFLLLFLTSNRSIFFPVAYFLICSFVFVIIFSIIPKNCLKDLIIFPAFFTFITSIILLSFIPPISANNLMVIIGVRLDSGTSLFVTNVEYKELSDELKLDGLSVKGCLVPMSGFKNMWYLPGSLIIWSNLKNYIISIPLDSQTTIKNFIVPVSKDSLMFFSQSTETQKKEAASCKTEDSSLSWINP